MTAAPTGATFLVTASLLAGCSPTLEALPSAAIAEGVAVEVPAAGGVGGSRYTVLLAQAGGATGGSGVAAGETVVSRRDDGKPPLTISSTTSDWDLRNKKASFTGSVVVTRGSVKLRCSTLQVTYGTADNVESVVATGDVVVETGARVASAQRAELVGATGEVTLTESPRLVDGPNTLAGTRIRLWLDDERATCEGDGGAPCTLVVAGWTVGP